MNKDATQPLLTIPSESEGSAVFMTRVAGLISAATTHIYIDTSFLMWLTKVGSTSRKELIDWLSANCPARLHVPIWAAHEYLRHHVADTIVGELSEKTDEIAGIVGRTYSYFRPYVDEPMGPGQEDPASLRASTRDALNSLRRLTDITRQWHTSYQRHAAEVIAFINAHVPDKTDLYSYFPTLDALGSGRYSGSVPPGFQDRRKKGKHPDDTSVQTDGAPAGSNRFGDLLFWKEVLDHAKRAGATCIIILTNDRKNDWHLGGGDMKNVERDLLALKKTWKPVPCAHPMLTLEAKLFAEVDAVVLLDSPYLAVLLRELAPDEVRSFFDVAIIPDGSLPASEAERRDEAIGRRLAADAAEADAEAREMGVRFLDGPRVLFTLASLRRALLESRAALDEKEMALVNLLRSDVAAVQTVGDLLTPDTLDGLDHKQIVRLARELHDRVLAGAPGYGEALADLVSLLDEFPFHTAGCFYLGFLASMYLDRNSNTTRLPPRSSVAQLLFTRQGAPYAALPIATLAKRLSDSESQPIYRPDVDRPMVSVAFDIEPDTELIDELASLRIAGVEVLTPGQQDATLKLSTLFPPGATTDGHSIVAKACEIFAIPIGQIERTDDLDRVYALTPTVGFKRPQDVFVQKEEPGAT